MSTGKSKKLLLLAILLLMLPLLAFPHLLTVVPEDYKMLLWFYPPYVIASGYLAYRSWWTRIELSYILLFILILSHMAIWLLPYAK